MAFRRVLTGSELNGADQDLATWARVEIPDEREDEYHELVGGYRPMQAFFEDISAGEFIRLDDDESSDEIPGMSDIYWEVRTHDTAALRREVQERLCEALDLPLPGRRGKRRPPASPDAAILGALEGMTEEYECDEKGVSAVKLRRLLTPQLTQLVGASAWETVTRFSMERGKQNAPLPTEPVIQLLSSPAMRSLTEVLDLDHKTFLALCELPLSLERVDAHDNIYWSEPHRFPVPRLRAKTLSLRLYSTLSLVLDWIRGDGAPLLAETERLFVQGFHAHEDALGLLSLKTAPRLTSIGAPGFEAVREGAGWRLTWAPCIEDTDRDDVASTLRGLPDLLATHRAKLTKLELQLPKVQPALLTPVREAMKDVKVARLVVGKGTRTS